MGSIYSSHFVDAVNDANETVATVMTKTTAVDTDVGVVANNNNNNNNDNNKNNKKASIDDSCCDVVMTTNGKADAVDSTNSNTVNTRTSTNTNTNPCRLISNKRSICRRVSFHDGYITHVHLLPSFFFADDDDDDNFDDDNTDRTNVNEIGNENENDDDTMRKVVVHNDDVVKINKSQVYYTDEDYKRFKLAEQKRYNKMISKKIQQCVRNKLKKEIDEYRIKNPNNNNIDEEIERYVLPQSYEEIVTLLGGDIIAAITAPTVAMATTAK